MRVSVPSRGLSYLKIASMDTITTNNQVSVPSRGLSYLKNDFQKYLEVEETVSVPSRGLSYLKVNALNTNKITLKKFPSPHGDSLI